jgi:pilus assembly protein CpaB
MESSQTRTLWISIGLALLAMFMLYSWSQEQRAQMNHKFGSTKRVVVATQDIAEMETIDESKLEVVDQPVDFIQPDAIAERDVAVGQVAAVPIKRGEQLLQTKLLLPGPETGLSMEISPGKRALVIPIDETRGVARLLRPGDRIDIVAALDYGKGSDAKREVRTVLQDVVILATGLNIVNKIPRRFELDSNGKTVNRINLNALSPSTAYTTLTIEVKVEDVQMMVYLLATSPGGIFTTLRHPSDRQPILVRSTTIDDILGKTGARIPASAPVPAPQPALPAYLPPMKTSARPAPARQDGRFKEL